MVSDVFGGMRLRRVILNRKLTTREKQSLHEWLLGVWGFDIWVTYYPGSDWARQYLTRGKPSDDLA